MHRPYGVESTWFSLCDLDQCQGQIMYFVVNAYYPKPLDVATSNFKHGFHCGTLKLLEGH